ncbi:phosphonoacetaldehyde hydrolase [Singulisphaera acidiphila]|uniref:phosphonoacetaldehyde hydrolase n=1 Tax=Singulisphaera acidiphila (strain ATCC BAA-1392 / DSM 18658 / VKM B-2454 / MOB10) TaxID=886293 RepID=L0D863_SINAD|nr:phosphonoacetaldehyde hydrolase [Singulisphaera acidiphila]AGA24836.1 phosphonoacetaldehyde hydrolase [Singulisphaera acidiphila DSM 18658]
MSSRLKAVIFDWAGTTVDHGSRAPARAFVEIFGKSGVAIDEAEARGPMGKAKRDHIASILFLPRVSAAWREEHGALPGEADIDRLYNDFLPLQLGSIANHADVIPGVPEVVDECRRRGLKIGGTTGYTRSLMDVLEPIARDNGYCPDVSICADDTPQGRPAPWMLFRAAERLGVYPMSCIVAVDDTSVGVEAGRNAGAWVVGVTRTGNGLGLSREELDRLDPHALGERLAGVAAELERAGAHFIIESVADLLPVLDQINERLVERGRAFP